MTDAGDRRQCFAAARSIGPLTQSACLNALPVGRLAPLPGTGPERGRPSTARKRVRADSSEAVPSCRVRNGIRPGRGARWTRRSVPRARSSKISTLRLNVLFRQQGPEPSTTTTMARSRPAGHPRPALRDRLHDRLGGLARRGAAAEVARPQLRLGGALRLHRGQRIGEEPRDRLLLPGLRLLGHGWRTPARLQAPLQTRRARPARRAHEHRDGQPLAPGPSSPTAPSSSSRTTSAR